MAASITSISIGVAITVNLLTSGWSWLFFVVLALLSGAWIGLESWRAVPTRVSGESLGAPVKPTVIGSFVPRPELASPIVRMLLAGKTGKVGITTGLTGAGGFGKTTLAEDVCSRTEINKAFAHIYWIPVGQELRGAALADSINDISERVDGQRPGLTSPEQAGIRLGELLKAKGRCLLVVDDIWTAEQLRPFVNAGRGCTLLVTTRFTELLPNDTETVEVDQMSRTQARELVTGGLALPATVSDQLLDITGRWPLALGLANGALRRAARDGADVTTAAEKLLHRLRELGPAALDVTDAARRSRAVAATLESSFSLLGDRRERVVELGIFPEDTEIPVDLVIQLWQATAALTRDEGDELCRELADLSLVVRSSSQHTLRLHDVIRAYLRHDSGAERIKYSHGVLLDEISPELTAPTSKSTQWWQLPESSEYLWRNLAYHLLGAGRDTEVAALVTEPHWVIRKLRKLGPVAVAEDLALVDTGPARELGRFLDQLGHLLTPTEPEHAVVNALAHRLPPTPTFAELRRVAVAEVTGFPRLVPYRELPDMPNPALNRVLIGHQNDVEACAFTPDGKWLLSAADDGLRVWDAERGQLVRLVVSTESSFYSGFALSPSGRLLVAEGSNDKTVQVLETTGWQTETLLIGHRSWVTSCCFSADERTVISSGDDNTLRVWDIETGKQLHVIKTTAQVRGCASLLDGRVIGLEDGHPKIWDPASGNAITLPKTQMSHGTELAVSPNQRWAVVPAEEGMVVHDLKRAGEPPRMLRHHHNLTCAVFSPDGTVLATGSEDGHIVLWNVETWRPAGQIPAYLTEINKLAFSPTARRWHRPETTPPCDFGTQRWLRAPFRRGRRTPTPTPAPQRRMGPGSRFRRTPQSPFTTRRRPKYENFSTRPSESTTWPRWRTVS
ncbi:NB-ARC domain-containing protein [Amycolatopsis sp. EV170708-02-1]|nr:NB-ARC domain-containing protein [Amycolatopsis sp. EV170708-02-1]UMP00018.1 NB-ARC domain-containing protein [Amycolatopsis sp. EV170708-02-1]